MITLATGAAAGLLRGMAAAAVYAALLAVELVIADFIEGHVLHTTAPSGVGDLASGFVLFSIVILFLAGMVGAAGGLVLGAALVPAVNRWTGSRRALGWIVGAAGAMVGLVAFPTIPLGWGQVSGIVEALTLKVLPAVLLGLAAAWHVVSLHRLRTGDVRRAAGPATAPHAPPTGAASDA